MGISNHREMEVWRLADQIRTRVAAVVQRPELKGADWLWLRTQLRKASNSACSNIAEGFGRFEPRDFARFMRISRASIKEIGEHLLEPEIVRALPAMELRELHELIERSDRASGRFIHYLVHAKPPKTRPRTTASDPDADSEL